MKNLELIFGIFQTTGLDIKDIWINQYQLKEIMTLKKYMIPRKVNYCFYQIVVKLHMELL